MKIEECLAASMADAGCRYADLVGMFYPQAAEGLNVLPDALFASTGTSTTSRYGVLVLHAGCVNSGTCVLCAYAKIFEASSVTHTVIDPIHADCVIVTSDLVWVTPFCQILPSNQLVATLNAVDTPNFPTLLWAREGLSKVQVFFIIRYRSLLTKVMPVLFGTSSLATMKIVVNVFPSVVDAVNANVVTLASSDGSHYIPTAISECHDLIVFAATTKRDVHAFYEQFIEIKPSMCGYSWIAAVMTLCKQFEICEGKVIMCRASSDMTCFSHEVASDTVTGAV
jgi:AmmeMemoRadiSam system protein B